MVLVQGVHCTVIVHDPMDPSLVSHFAELVGCPTSCPPTPPLLLLLLLLLFLFHFRPVSCLSRLIIVIIHHPTRTLRVGPFIDGCACVCTFRACKTQAGAPAAAPLLTLQTAVTPASRLHTQTPSFIIRHQTVLSLTMPTWGGGGGRGRNHAHTTTSGKWCSTTSPPRALQLV
jgi:hypothetical protein